MTFDPRFVQTAINKLEPLRYEDVARDVDPDSLDDDKLARLCELKRVLDLREKEYKILYYKPQKHQAPFHNSTAKVRLVCGGNQSGKSIAGFNEGLMIALGVHPTKKIPTPNKGRVGAMDLKEGIGEIIQNHLDEWLPPNEVRQIKKGPTGVVSKITLKNGSTIDFLSYEQDKKVWEGWVGDWADFDEPPPRHAYIGTLRGLMRRKGLLWITATPLDEPWMYDEIYLKDGKDGIEVFNFDMWDNAYISREEKEAFLSKLDPDERQAREHGRFRHLSGLIHKTFDRKIHCIKSFVIPKEWPRYMSIDYHPQKPCALIWMAINPKDKAIVYDELLADSTVASICERIKAKEVESGSTTNVRFGNRFIKKSLVRMRFIDPLSSMPDRISGRNPQREFATHGIRCRGWGKNFTAGKNAVNEYLALDKEGKPSIYFFDDKVPQVINSYHHYQWSDDLREDENIRGKAKQKFSDLPDCVRGILLFRPKFSRPQTPETPQGQYTAHKFTGYGH